MKQIRKILVIPVLAVSALLLELVLSMAITSFNPSTVSAETTPFCQQKYPYDNDATLEEGDLHWACTTGYDTKKCDLTEIYNDALYNGTDKTKMTAACNKGVTQRKKDEQNGSIIKQDCSGAKPNPGSCKKECTKINGYWDVSLAEGYMSCNIDVDQGTCNSYGGQFNIGYYGTGSPLTCVIDHTAQVGEGGTCGESGCVDVAEPYCDGKYAAKAVSDACEKGFYGGAAVCEDYQRPKLKNACKDGAKSQEENFPEAEPLTPSNLESCDSSAGFEGDPALCHTSCTSNDCNFIIKYVNPAINKFLAPLAVLAVVIGVIWGAITYSMSGGDPQKAAQGKSRIQKSLIGLVSFVFLYALLNWLIPGGV